MADEASGESEDVEFRIDTDLITRWFDIPADEAIQIELPRVSLDMLYVAIEKPYFAIARMMAMITADERGDADERDAAFKDVKSEVLRGLNSLRQWQSVIMLGAVEAQSNASTNDAGKSDDE